MEYIIESVKLGDEEVLAYIQTESWKAAFKDILSEEVLEKYTNLDKATEMYKALIEQKIGNGYLLKIDGKAHAIAWWNTTREADMPGYAELICIHSLPDRWRSGFGSKLMNRVLEDIKIVGYSKVMLWVFAENTSARAFYEKHGFRANGTEKESFGTTEICYELKI